MRISDWSSDVCSSDLEWHFVHSADDLLLLVSVNCQLPGRFCEQMAELQSDRTIVCYLAFALRQATRLGSKFANSSSSTDHLDHLHAQRCGDDCTFHHGNV